MANKRSLLWKSDLKYGYCIKLFNLANSASAACALASAALIIASAALARFSAFFY